MDNAFPANKISFDAIRNLKEPKKLMYPILYGLLGLVFLATVIVFAKVQSIKPDEAIEIISGSAYRIENGEILLAGESMDELNMKLRNTGIQIDTTGIFFGKTEYISVMQIQQLLDIKNLDSQNLNEILRKNVNQLKLLIFFYFYVKEGITFLMLGVLLLVFLGRTLQKQISKARIVSFKQAVLWGDALGVVPLLFYGGLTFLEVRLMPRLFISVMAYVLLVFFYGRFYVKNLKLVDEK